METGSGLRLLGLTTYPFYLLHETLGGFVLYRTDGLGLNHYLGIFIAMLVVGAIAFWVAWYAEPALRNRLKRLIAAPQPVSAAPA